MQHQTRPKRIIKSETPQFLIEQKEHVLQEDLCAVLLSERMVVRKGALAFSTVSHQLHILAGRGKAEFNGVSGDFETPG